MQLLLHLDTVNHCLRFEGLANDALLVGITLAGVVIVGNQDDVMPAMRRGLSQVMRGLKEGVRNDGGAPSSNSCNSILDAAQVSRQTYPQFGPGGKFKQGHPVIWLERREGIVGHPMELLQGGTHASAGVHNEGYRQR